MDAPAGGVSADLSAQERGGGAGSQTATDPGRPPAVTQPFTARAMFDKSIARARTMLRLYELGCAHGGSEEDFADAHRAAIVLAISALDAFVRKHVLDTVGGLLQTPKGKALDGTLKARIANLVKHDQLLDALRSDDVHSTIMRALKDDFDTKSFQRTDTIVDAFRLIGVNDIMKDVAGRANINDAKMRKQLDHFTKRRHIVVHRGGYDFDQNPPLEHPISEPEVVACIDLVIVIVTHMPEGER